jgi:hypothetical protein
MPNFEVFQPLLEDEDKSLLLGPILKLHLIMLIRVSKRTVSSSGVVLSVSAMPP